MSFEDDLDGVRRDRYTLVVDAALTEIAAKDEALSEKVLACLRDRPHYPDQGLAEVFTKNGYPMKRGSIWSWRARDKAEHPEFYSE